MKNVSGAACYWNSSTCVDLTCANAPTSITTNDGCVAYLSTCTLSSSGTGCADKTCENI